MNINLYIERLVLQNMNMGPNARGSLQATLTGELTRLLNEGGVRRELSGGVALSALPPSDIHSKYGGGPEQLGQQIAQAIYRGIGE